ncbi:class I SAM-dependent methyltransferase [Turneriella parva]|nr:class I SAM-dependent methyltransferase [Turneriella parva]
MPDEEYWESLFDIETAMQRVGPLTGVVDAVEFGSGYGTFSLPLAKKISGQLYALELETDLIHRLKARAESQNVNNIILKQIDFVAQGTGIAAASVDYVCLFNILHFEEPVKLIDEARRILNPGGLLAVMHWRFDDKTPRGPAMDIRPTPEKMRLWLNTGKFQNSEFFDLPPYHYGFMAKKEVEWNL